MQNTIKKDHKNILINIKVNKMELEKIKEVATKYADGNVSLWMRYAAINHVYIEENAKEEIKIS